MLVLSRTKGQSVVIVTPQGPVTVTLIEQRHGQVRIGIETPPGMQVDREEVHLAKKAAKVQAVMPASS